MNDSVLTYDKFMAAAKKAQQKIEATGPQVIAIVINHLLTGCWQCRTKKGDYFLVDPTSWKEIKTAAERILPDDPRWTAWGNFRGIQVIEDDELAKKILRESAEEWLRENELTDRFHPHLATFGISPMRTPPIFSRGPDSTCA